jgi:hypothetical protein
MDSLGGLAMDRHVPEWNASPDAVLTSRMISRRRFLGTVSGMERICIETSGHGR